jgi:hypothetical protein
MFLVFFLTFLFTTAGYTALLIWAWVRLRKACREDPDAAKAIVILLRGKQENKINPSEVSRC